MKKSILCTLMGLFSLCIGAQTGKELPFQKWALTPPMGWNSWDCFGPTIVESEVKSNADYMASKLLAYGWEYVVVDIRWFVENDKAGGYNQTDPIYVYDEYGRYTPAVNRFPSAGGGKGFKPLADYIHNLGLKFGIHIMRGIPKEAVAQKLPVKGTNGITCDMIANNDSACTWLRDNMKVDCTKKGAQEYYNSIFNLYAEWGVDFIKIDDLSRPYHTGEIEMIRHAIDQCGRPIVLSMSPGETPLEKYEHARTHANMWRTVDDFWDNWSQLNYQFSVCAKWAPYIAPGTWPDADMLPLGKISIRGERGNERWTNFTKDEQYTLMSLWSIFKSPLMFGGNLPDNNAFTDSLLTNKEVLYMHNYSANNRQLSRLDHQIIWAADDPGNGDKFAAVFNTGGDEFAYTKNALYRSGTISYLTTGYGQDMEVEIPEGSKLLSLVVSDAGDGYDFDHSDWINPTLIMKDGSELSLTELDYIKGTCGWGSIHKNQNLNGGTLSVNGQTYEKGFAVHANSVMVFVLPEGAMKFKSFIGIDNTGTDEGSKSSVEFMVFNEDPTTRKNVDPQKAVANSQLICRKYQKEGTTLTADITNAKKLYLVATDAGDGIDYDHANWANPVLIDANGNKTSLTDLKWDGKPVNGWGDAQINKNNDGGPLSINGTVYEKGYGVNSNSIITFTLPEGHNYTSFSAFVGYDDGVENADKGVTMEFLVFTEDPTPSKIEEMSLDLRKLGYQEGQECKIRDMWSGKDLGTYKNDSFAPLIRQHGSGLYRISPVQRTEESTVTLHTDKDSYSSDEVFNMTATVQNGTSEGAYVQLWCDNEIVGTLPLQNDGTATYECSGLYNGDHTFKALYSGTVQTGSAVSENLVINIEGGSSEDLTPLRQKLQALLNEANNLDLTTIAGATRVPLTASIEKGNNANTESKIELNDAVDALTTALADARASIIPMQSLDKTIMEASVLYEKIKEPDKSVLYDGFLTAQESYDNELSTTEDITKVQTDLAGLITTIKRTAQPIEGEYIEMTEYIVNPSFETNSINGWTLSQEGSGWGDASTWSDRPADEGAYFVSVARQNISWLDFYQDVRNLPDGIYSLSAAMRNTEGEDVLTDQHFYAQAGEQEAIDSDPLTHIGGDNNNDWSTLQVDNIVLRAGETLRIGAKSTGKGTGNAGWFHADNFRLFYLGKDPNKICEITTSGYPIQILTQENGVFIESEKAFNLPIYTLSGTLLSISKISEGQNYISLPKGQYLINASVIIIK